MRVEHTHARPRVGESTPHGAHRDPPESHVTHASDTDSQSAARSVSPRVSCRTHTTSPCTAGRIEHRTTAPRGSRARERSRLHTSVGSSHGRHVACQRCHDRHRCLCLSLPPRSRLCTYSRPFTTTPHDSTDFSVHTPTPHQDSQHQPRSRRRTYVSAHCQKRLSNSSCEAASSVSR